jgi:hypothetical protein
VTKAATATKKDPATIWWCENCHASGMEHGLARVAVYDAVLTLELAHNTHALAVFAGCRFSTATVRVQEAKSV